MRFSLPLAALLLAASIPQAAIASDGAAEVKKSDMIYSSDGKRIGRVYDIVSNSDGSSRARVIYQGKFVSVPVSSLTAGEKGFVSSLSREEIKSGG